MLPYPVRTIALEFGPNLGEFGDDIEARAIFKAHVDDGKRRRLFANEIDTFRYRMPKAHLEASKLHSPRQTLQKRTVVVDDDQRAIRRQFILFERQVFGNQGSLQHHGFAPMDFLDALYSEDYNPTPPLGPQPLKPRKSARQGYQNAAIGSNLGFKPL